jgi:hypothetical protein
MNWLIRIPTANTDNIKARLWTWFWANSIQFTASKLVSLRPVVILSYLFLLVFRMATLGRVSSSNFSMHLSLTTELNAWLYLHNPRWKYQVTCIVYYQGSRYISNIRNWPINANWLTDWPTDRPTDRPTNLPTYLPTWSSLSWEANTHSSGQELLPRLFFTVRSCQFLAHPSSWRTTPCRLSATAFSVHSQLPTISWGCVLHATWKWHSNWKFTQPNVGTVFFVSRRRFVSKYVPC